MEILKKRLTRKQKQRLADAATYALEHRDRKHFERIVSDVLGLKPDSPEMTLVRMKWNEAVREDK